MKVATWNVNSLKVRLPHLLEWLAANPVDVICLQETKQQDADFPQDDLQKAGYFSAFSGQRTYNGVAILSREPMSEVQFGMLNFEDDQKRVVSATCRGVRMICAYMPNGERVGSEKYEYKLKWLAAMNEWLAVELKKYPRLALLGDFNIAPEDRDVYDPQAWQGSVLCSEPERAAFRAFEQTGVRDTFRLFEQPDKSYTWWDYRMGAFRRNMGLRIDHIMVSPALQCRACTIDTSPRRLERPSDHVPVIAEIE